MQNKQWTYYNDHILSLIQFYFIWFDDSIHARILQPKIIYGVAHQVYTNDIYHRYVGVLTFVMGWWLINMIKVSLHSMSLAFEIILIMFIKNFVQCLFYIFCHTMLLSDISLN